MVRGTSECQSKRWISSVLWIVNYDYFDRSVRSRPCTCTQRLREQCSAPCAEKKVTCGSFGGLYTRWRRPTLQTRIVNVYPQKSVVGRRTLFPSVIHSPPGSLWTGKYRANVKLLGTNPLTVLMTVSGIDVNGYVTVRQYIICKKSKKDLWYVYSDKRMELTASRYICFDIFGCLTSRHRT